MKEKLQHLQESPMMMRILPFVLLLIIIGGFSLATQGKFSEFRNLSLMVNQAIIIATVATGAVFIFGTGNISIALGATTSLTATLCAMIYQKTESVVFMIIAAIVIGVVIMIASALLSTVIKVSVMFVSIVMMVLMMAVVQTILGASTISLPYAMTSAMIKMNFSPIAFLLYFILCALLFHLTGIGRGIKFIGANRFCAQQSGLYMGKHLMIAFSITGVGIGLAAIMNIIRTGTVSVSTASSLNMDVVLAVVLGGMSIFGGSKSFIYAGVLGALTVTILNNGLLMIGISPTVLQLVRGIIFLSLIFIGQKRPDRLPTNEI